MYMEEIGMITIELPKYGGKRRKSQADGQGKNVAKQQKKNIEEAIFTEKFPGFLMTNSHRYIKCERKAELSHSHSWLLK